MCGRGAPSPILHQLLLGLMALLPDFFPTWLQGPPGAPTPTLFPGALPSSSQGLGTPSSRLGALPTPLVASLRFRALQSIFFFLSLRPHLQHMEVPGPGVE